MAALGQWGIASNTLGSSQLTRVDEHPHMAVREAWGMTGTTRHKPKVIAHRGASSRAAEHTLAAYQRAIEAGADLLECDVRLTADGHLVCVHDPRIDRTSDGTGRVSTKTLADLMDHDFGSWWSLEQAAAAGLADDELPDYDQELNGILTLDRLLELANDAPRSVGLAIETKHPTRYGGYAEKVLAQTLERHGLVPASGAATSVRVMSFSSIAMYRMKDRAPTVPTVYLMEKVPVLWRTGQLPSGATIAGPSLEIVKQYPQYVKRWRKNGIGLFVWTVDTLADLHEAVELGADAVITNRPGDMVHLLADWEW